ncbi:MAG: hypothetical protein MUC96_14650 [Myxococcaceae bacterium]|jgi:hypothetical protein|nr:hypothetical protein [Myxococcaceae bacterium]
MSSITTARPVAPVTAPVAAPVSSFAAFFPTKLSKLRDGGTVLVDGQLNKSVSARIRMDGGINSPTRGQFFVTTRHFLQGARPERAMTQAELKDLQAAITRHMAKTPGRQPEYVEFNARIREALAKSGPARVDVAKIPTSILGPNANASVNGSMWIDRMPGPGPRSNTVQASVTIQGNGFDDAPPKYAVKKIEVYEQGTNKLVATFNNPKGTDTGRIGRGTHGLEFALKLDGSKLDLSKQYAFVFTTGINGAAPKQVRSEFMNVGQVF